VCKTQLSINAILKQLNAISNPRDAIQLTMDWLLSLTALNCICIYYADNDEKRIRLVGEVVIYNKPRSALYLQEGTVAVQAIQEQRIIFTEDAMRDQQFGARMLANGVLTGITLPIKVRNRVMGVIQLSSTKQVSLSPALIETAELLTQQFGMILESLYLEQRLLDRDSKLEGLLAKQKFPFWDQSQHLKAILHSVTDAVIITDTMGQLVTVNHAAESLLNSDLNEEVTEQLTQWVTHLLQTTMESPTRLINHGQTILQAKAARIHEAGVTVGIVIVLRDVTHLHEEDRPSAERSAQLLHEIHTPLSNIKLYLQLLQTGKPEKRDTYYRILDQKTAELESMIHKWLMEK
jgi:transcriptional regulator with PAS, ATPase and Fis domain